MRRDNEARFSYGLSQSRDVLCDNDDPSEDASCLAGGNPEPGGQPLPPSDNCCCQLSRLSLSAAQAFDLESKSLREFAGFYPGMQRFPCKL